MSNHHYRPTVPVKIARVSAAIVKWGVLIVLILNFITSYFILKERADRRDAVNNAVCALLNAVPEGASPRLDEVRAEFKCGHPNPPLHLTPTPTPKSTKTVTVTATPSASPTVTHTCCTIGAPPFSVSPGRSQLSATNGPTRVALSAAPSRSPALLASVQSSQPPATNQPPPSPQPTPLLSPICRLTRQLNLCP